MTGIVPYAGWQDIPVTYVICQQDRVMTMDMEAYSKSLNVASVERLDAGHVPFQSMPQKVAEIIRRAAGEQL